MRGERLHYRHQLALKPLCVVVLALLLPGWLHAQETWPKVLDRLVESERRVVETEAEVAALNALSAELQKRLEGRAPPPLAPNDFHLVGVRATVLRTIESAGALRKAHEDLRAVFKHSIDVLDTEENLALRQYRAALQAANAQAEERSRIEWQLQQSVEQADGYQRWVPPLMARALLLGLGISCLGVFAWRFEERLALRRFLRRQSATGAALLAGLRVVLVVSVLALAIGLAWLAFWPDATLHVRSPDHARRRHTDLAVKSINANQQRLLLLDQPLRRARAGFDSLREQGVRDWTNLIPADKDMPLNEMQRAEKDTADQLRALYQIAYATERIAQETKNLNERTLDEQQRLETFVGDAADRGPWYIWGRVGSVSAPLGFFALAIAGSRLRRWRAWRRQSRQCPRCLQTTLVKQPRVDTEVAALPVYDLKCGAKIGGEDCNYAFPVPFNQLPRLCFPTYGHCASGKTTWLALVYDHLNTGDRSLAVRMKPVRTETNAAFDELARQILVAKKPPGATPADALPAPLLYHVIDGDRLSATNVLLNVFDFPGEIAHFRSVARQDGSYRALSMNGFLFFLDPTAPIEPQFKSLLAFHQGLRELGRLDLNAPLTTPMAVCITKLDRLAQTPLHQMALPWLAQLRKTVGRAPTLALLRERSEMVRRIVPELFQGFNLLGELRGNFGAGFLFFPQTNFGLQEEELGLASEERGALTSFGTLEPLLWLLHMNGLQVF